jgi:hypothetical protein
MTLPFLADEAAFWLSHNARPRGPLHSTRVTDIVPVVVYHSSNPEMFIEYRIEREPHEVRS